MVRLRPVLRRSRARYQKKPTWVPRARRLTLQTPVRYRPKGLGTWHEGTVENLSQSGVLLYGPQQLPDNTLVEMVFEMPEEISGQKNSTVLCQGRIIRRKDVRDPENGRTRGIDSRLQVPAQPLTRVAAVSRSACNRLLNVRPKQLSGYLVTGLMSPDCRSYNFAQDQNAFCI